jgi:acyl-CoA reductase-like NAD-dependent aldehyde dehydrogenase
MRNAIVSLAQRVRIGNGLYQDTQLGPLQNAAQLAKVRQYIDEARAQGLTVHECGVLAPGTEHGYFLRVHIVDNPPDNAPVVCEERE